ncbi:hypothetical protein SNEBB_003260 [Seison nebaliae]|nr:hypothetical protein SNEBB_003260 [Seison nebaliae]
MNVLLFVVSFIFVFHSINSLTVPVGSEGCYKGPHRDGFSQNPATYNRNKLVPQLCVDACGALQNPLVTHAAVIHNNCMCAISLTLVGNSDYTILTTNDCKGIACPGDSSMSCGGSVPNIDDYDLIPFLIYTVGSVTIETISIAYNSALDVENSLYIETSTPELQFTPTVTTTPTASKSLIKFNIRLFTADDMYNSFFATQLDDTDVIAKIALPYPGLFSLKVIAYVGTVTSEVVVNVKYNDAINKDIDPVITFQCATNISLLNNLYNCESTIWYQNKDLVNEVKSKQKLIVDYGSNITSFDSVTSEIPYDGIIFQAYGPLVLRAFGVKSSPITVLIGNIFIDRPCYLVNAIVAGTVTQLIVARPTVPKGFTCDANHLFCGYTGKCTNMTNVDSCFRGAPMDHNVGLTTLQIVHTFASNEINSVEPSAINIGNTKNEFSFELLPGDRIIAEIETDTYLADTGKLTNTLFQDSSASVSGDIVTIDLTTKHSPVAIGLITAIPSGVFLGYEYASTGIFSLNVSLEHDDQISHEESTTVISVKEISRFNISIDETTNSDDFHIDMKTDVLSAKSETILKFNMDHLEDESTNGVIYEVKIEEVKTNYSINTFNYSFLTNGQYVIEIRAVNLIDEKISLLPITIIDPVKDLNLTLLGGISAIKDSITYAQVDVKGQSYKCEFWYNYVSPDTEYDSIHTAAEFPSGSMLQHIYRELGEYKLRVKCYNFLSSDEAEETLYVQERISGVEFGKLIYYFNEEYQIVANVATGSSMTASLYLYDNLDTLTNVSEPMTVNGYQLATAVKPAATKRISYELTLEICNNLGCVRKQDYLLIDYNIRQPSITTNIPITNKLNFGDSVTLDIEMLDGTPLPSDVKLEYDFGDNSPISEDIAKGSVLTDFSKSFTYDTIAGNLVIIITMSNLVNKYTSAFNIAVISPIGDHFLLKLVQNPLSYQLKNALAEVYLEPKSPGVAHYGQPAEGQCWWGDNTKTPLSFGTDASYIDMSNQMVVSHLYLTSLSYDIICEVGNEAGYVNLTTTVDIRQAVVGLQIRMNQPLVGQSEDIKVTALRGPPIAETTLKYYIDSSLKKTDQRQNELYEEFDVYSHTFTSSGLVEIKVEAIDTVTNRIITTKKNVNVKANIQPTDFSVEIIGPETDEARYTSFGATYNFKLKYLSASITSGTNPVDSTKNLFIKMFVKETQEQLLRSETATTITFSGNGNSDEEFLLDSSLNVIPFKVSSPGTFTVVVQLSNNAKTINVERQVSLYAEPYFDTPAIEVRFKPNLPVGASNRIGYGPNSDIYPFNVQVEIIPKIVEGALKEYKLLVNDVVYGTAFARTDSITYTLSNVGPTKLSLQVNYGISKSKNFNNHIINVKKSLDTVSLQFTSDGTAEVETKVIGQTTSINLVVSDSPQNVPICAIIYGLDENLNEKKILGVLQTGGICSKVLLSDYHNKTGGEFLRLAQTQSVSTTEIINVGNTVVPATTSIFNAAKTFEVKAIVFTEFITLTGTDPQPLPAIETNELRIVVSNVVNTNCKPPTISLTYSGNTKENRRKVYRSKRAIFEVIVDKIECDGAENIKKKWKIFKLDSYGEQTGELDLTEFDLDDVDLASNNLIIPKNKMELGFYVAQFSIEMTSSTIENIHLFNQVRKEYFEVVKSPIILRLYPGVVSTLQWQYLTDFKLSMDEYSYDSDIGNSVDVAKVDEKNFVEYHWFCKRIGEDLILDPSIGKYDVTTVKTPKFDKNAPDLGGCFGTGPGRIGTIEISTKLLLPTSYLDKDHVYEIIGTAKFVDGRESETSIILELKEEEVLQSSVKCLLPDLCKPVNHGQQINFGSRITVSGNCLNCNQSAATYYAWTVSYLYDEEMKELMQSWPDFVEPDITKATVASKATHVSDGHWIHIDNVEEFAETTNSEFVFDNGLMDRFPMVKEWKIKLSISNKKLETNSVVILLVNQPPKGGKCTMDKFTGTVDDDYELFCKGWKDDGEVNRFVVIVRDPTGYLEETIDTIRATDGAFAAPKKINLPVTKGLLWMRIFDELESYTELIIGQLDVTNVPLATAQTEIDSIKSLNFLDKYEDTGVMEVDQSNPLLKAITEGNLQSQAAAILKTTQMLQSLSQNQVDNGLLESVRNTSTVNITMANNTKNILGDVTTAMENGNPITGFPSDLSKDVSFDLLENSMKTSTSNMLTEEKYAIPDAVYQQKVQRSYSSRPNLDDPSAKEREENGKVLNFLVRSMENSSVPKTVDEVALKATALSGLAKMTTGMSRQTVDSLVDQCNRLARTLHTDMSDDISLATIRTAAQSIANCASNTIEASVGTAYGRVPTLATDFDRATKEPEEFDTDLENVWMNDRSFTDSSGSMNADLLRVNRNVRKTRQMAAKNSRTSLGSLQRIGPTIMKHLVPGDIITVPSTALRMTIRSKSASNMDGMIINEGYSRIKLPKWCEMVKSDCQVTSPRKVNVQSMALNVAPLQKINPDYGVQKGLSDDDVPVSMSTTAGLTLFDENENLIQIQNTTKEISLMVPRDPKMLPPPFIEYNAIVDGRTQRNPMFKYHQFNISTKDASVHINIQPNQPGTCYVVIAKRSTHAIFNSTKIDVDDVQVIGNTNGLDMNYYQYNLLDNKGFKGMLSIGIREVYSNENLCNDTGPFPIVNQKTLITDKVAEFSSNYSLRLFVSGCYYYSDNRYHSDGLRVGSKTTWKYTECFSNHLSEFAGGWIVLPAAIDFNYVFANASFADNPTIYSTIIVIVVVYLLLLIYCRKKDIHDIEKLGVTPLPDNRASDKYFYEIVVFTGLRQNGGTESKVRFILSGDNGETGIRLMEDSKRKVFQRGAADAFIMASPSALGPLTYLRIWHDNSGKGKYASWYLKYVLVNDLQTNEKFYFVCQRWLGVEKEDGLIDRILPVANEAQRTEFSLLFTKKASRSMSDGHLWFSVFARPATSTFTRVQRLTCCFTLLFLTMVMNIMYYDIQKDDSASNSGLSVGPFHLTPSQIGVGVITSIIIIVPSMILVELFRRSRMRKPPPNRLREAIKKNLQNVSTPSKTIENFYDVEVDVALPPEEFRGLDASRCYSSSTIRRPDTAVSLRDIETEEQAGKYYKVASPKKTMNEKKKKKKRFQFPWWTIIFAYFLSFAISGICAFFIISKGIIFGDEKVADWLTSLVMSFFSSILFTQPIKVIALAVIFSLICKKQEDDDESNNNNEDDIVADIQNKSLKTDERWLHAVEGTDDQLITTRARARDVAPPNAYQLKEARAKRQKELEMMKVLKEIVTFCIFLMLLYVVAYGNRDARMFNMTDHLETVYANDRLYPFENVNSFSDFFRWFDNVLIPNFRATEWYNGDQPVNERGFIGDRANRLLGYGIVRQIRVKHETCKVVKQMGKFYRDCLDDYSLLNEEKRNFDSKWELYDWERLEYEKGQAKIFADFEMTKNDTEFFYTDPSQIDGLPYAGLRTLYSGGGYVFKIRGSTTALSEAINKLKDGKWLDQQTRAVFIEWGIYNAWANIFCSCTMLLEWLPTTGFIKSYRFEPMSLLNHYDGFALFKVICDVVFAIYIIFYTYGVIRQMYVKGKKKCCLLFSDFWFIVDFLIVTLSYAVIAMYIYRLVKGLDVAKTFKESNGNQYIRLQRVGYFNEMLSNFLGFIAFITTIKFLKLLRFNKLITSLGRTLALSVKQLSAFMAMFMIVFLGFGFAFYLTFGYRLRAFSTVLTASYTMMQMMLGKFEFAAMQSINSPLVNFMLLIYNFFVVWVLLTMFIAIINDSFATIKARMSNEQNQYEMLDFMFKKVKVWSGTATNPDDPEYWKTKGTGHGNVAYADQVKAFPRKVDELLFALNKVYVEQNEFDKAFTNKLNGEFK